MDDMNEKERKDARMAVLYELRLMFANDEKTEFTKQEILDKLDDTAIAMNGNG